MFARLTGNFEAITQDQGILDVNGVGYLVQCSRKTIAHLGVTATTTLLIETQVREDAIQLFGFQDASEQQWFRLLTSVQGVGAKAALAILSVCDPSALSLAIASGDKGMITRADGVGPKLGTRIVTELKDKVEKLALAVPQKLSSEQMQGPSIRAANTSEINQSMVEDAVSALMNLGYQRGEAFAVVARLHQAGHGDDLSALIRESLRELAA